MIERGKARSDPPPLQPTIGFRYNPSANEVDMSQEAIQQRRRERMEREAHERGKRSGVKKAIAKKAKAG